MPTEEEAKAINDEIVKEALEEDLKEILLEEGWAPSKEDPSISSRGDELREISAQQILQQLAAQSHLLCYRLPLGAANECVVFPRRP